MYVHCFKCPDFSTVTKQAYHNLVGEGKKEMAKKYAENGPKKLDWASSYVQTSSHDNVTEKNALKGMFGRKEILELEGVDVDGLDEKTKEAILKEVLCWMSCTRGWGWMSQRLLSCSKTTKSTSSRSTIMSQPQKLRKRRLIRGLPDADSGNRPQHWLCPQDAH